MTNVGEKTQNFRLDLSRFPLTKGFRAFSVRDCQQLTDVGAVKGGFDTSVRSHATLVYRLSENIEIGNIVRRNLKKTLAPEEPKKKTTVPHTSAAAKRVNK